MFAVQSYEKLLAHTYKKDILLIQERCKITPAFSLCVEGDCAIFIDEQKLPLQAERIVALAHELGHCETGSFYNEENPLDLKGRHEYRANRWAVRRLISWPELQSAFNQGVTERWELAEYFEVTEDFIDIAIEMYRRQGKRI